MRCLWLCRTLPFPLTAGDRIYSAKLAGALAGVGADVTFIGLAALAPPLATPGITWHPVMGGLRSSRAAVASGMPLVAARHATTAYRAEVAALARKPWWDAVIIDYHAMGWALKYWQRISAPRPVLVFVTHNSEASVTSLQWRDRTSSVMVRSFLLQNALKTRWFERRIVRACDVLTAITHADAASFARMAPGLRPHVLLPGHDGPRIASRTIDDTLPRTVLMFGSYRWSAKQANLRAFLDRANARLAAAGIRVCIVGDMDDALRRSLAGCYGAAEFVGYVDDPAPYLRAARLAVVAEPIGGGFKLKLLEYVFNRVPVAALDACVTGLADGLRAHMMLRPDIDALVAGITDLIDDVAQLDRMQRGAFAAAEHDFDWSDRGRTLYAAIAAARVGMAAATTPADPQFGSTAA